MDSKTVIAPPQSPIEKKKEKRQWPLKWYDWVCISFVLIGVVFFMLHQNYDASQKIASDVWGHIGIRLLVETLNAQRDANDTASKTYDDNKKVFIQQQFDGNFNTLLRLYEETIESYSANTSQRGREEMHNFAENLQKDINSTDKSYSGRVSTAAEGFNQKFYIPHRVVASVHFRTLYQLFQLIRDSDIEEEKKVLYAKMLRGRMSEDELLLLRYNCHCSYGKKMQTNINRFNLLKHLPVLSLIEFRKWREKFNENDFTNSLDTEFITLKKRIKNLLISQENNKDSIIYSDRYSIYLKTNPEKKELNIELVKNTKETSSKTIDKVFDSCSQEELKQLFYDFLYETFVGSNFGVFNNFDNLQIKNSHETTDEGLHKLKIVVNNTNGYVLTMHVRQNDDPKS